jgi:ATP-dependent exoDNAse (exonuclease V) beta subunit
VALSTTAGLERLIDQIIAEHDYDLAILTRPDGRRRYANLRKLGRLARSFEELRGRDVEGFVRFVFDRQSSGAHETEAFAEEEAGDAVRLLTIHAAKGLEFRVVVVADAGRDRPAPRGEEIICRPDGRFGFKVLNPTTGKRHGAFDYDAVREVEQEAEEAERLRLYYVAMTRAIDRLLVSGSIDPTRAREGRTPMGWVLNRLGSLDVDAVGPDPVVIDEGQARLLLRVDRYHPQPEETPAPPVAPVEEQLSLFPVQEELTAAPAVELPGLEQLEAPPVFEPRRLSYSALATFEECSSKFYARYVAGMRERRARGVLGAVGVGSAVHELMERIDLATPGMPDDLAALQPGATEEELASIERFLTAYCGSELAARLSGLEGARREQSFSFYHDGVVLHGFIDVLHLGERALVVDFKTNALEGADPERVVEEDYRLQRLVYALACLRAGAREVEVVYQFLEQPDAPVVTVFTSDDAPRLGEELSAAIARIRAGTFVPTPSERACADCPALDVVCAGPRLTVGA